MNWMCGLFAISATPPSGPSQFAKTPPQYLYYFPKWPNLRCIPRFVIHLQYEICTNP